MGDMIGGRGETCMQENAHIWQFESHVSLW